MLNNTTRGAIGVLLSLAVLGANGQCTTTSIDLQGPVLDQITWEMVDDATNTVVCSGGPYGGSSTASAQCCLPDGCYRFRILNQQGTGMGGGSYQVRVNGEQLLYGSAFGTTGEAPVPFCLPLGPNKMTLTSCDRLDLHADDVVFAVPDLDVVSQYGITNNTSGYQYNFFNPNGGYNRLIFVSHTTAGAGGGTGADRARRIRLNQISTNPIPANVLLNMRVRARVAGTNKPWGPSCSMMLGPAAITCPHTNLSTTAGPTLSCGVTGLVVGPHTKIYAEQVRRTTNGTLETANKYLWRFFGPGGYQRSIATTGNVLTLGSWTTAPLLCGTHEYFVMVQASFDGGATYCPLGHACTLGVTNNSSSCTPLDQAAMLDHSIVHRDGDVEFGWDLTAWPNPLENGQLNISMTLPDQHSEKEADLHIVDAIGRIVHTQRLPVSGGTSTHNILLGNELTPGLYIVNVSSVNMVHSTRIQIAD